MAKADVGDAAPDFELPGTGRQDLQALRLPRPQPGPRLLPGRRTTVCTKQFCSYRDEGERLDELDAEVLGISPQSVDSHERWAKEQDSTCRCSPTRTSRSPRRYGVTGWLGPLARFTELRTHRAAAT